MSSEAKICVIRVSTSVWFDGRTLHAEKKFTVMRRKSTTHDLIKEECDNAGAYDAFEVLTKTLDIEDGLYELKPAYFKDYETGLVDFINYEMVRLD